MANESDTTTPERLLAQVEWVRRLAAALVGRGDADEVVQQTYLQALSSPPRAVANLRGWLTTVVRNVARYRVRVEDRRATHERRAAEPSPAPDPAESVARAELHRRVVDAVLALDEPYRGTLLMRFFDDQSPEAIARAQTIPVETVRTRVKRGLALLRARLRDDDMKGVVALASSSAPVAITLSIGAKWAVAAALVLAVGTTVWIAAGSTSAPPPIAASAASRVETEVATHRAEPVAARVQVEASGVATTPPDPPAPITTPGTIRGVVTDRLERPVQGVTVWAVRWSRASSADRTSFAASVEARSSTKDAAARADDWIPAITDADGRFELANLSRYSDWTVGAFDPLRGAACTNRIRLNCSMESNDVVLRLALRVRVKGTVRNEQGEPDDDASIVLVTTDSSNSGFRSRSADAAPGTFDLGWIYAKSVRVGAYAWGFEHCSSELLEVDTPNQVRVVDLVLRRSKQFVDVSGSIVDESGSALDLSERVERLRRDARSPETPPCTVTLAAFDDKEWIPPSKPTGGTSYDDGDHRRPEVGQRLGAGGFRGRVDCGRATYQMFLLPDFRGEIALVVDGIVASIARLEDVSHPPQILFALRALPSSPPRATIAIAVVDAATGDAVPILDREIALDRAGLERSSESVATSRASTSGVHEFACRLGRVAIHVTHPGFAPAVAELELSKEGERREITLRLERATAGLRGQSLLADGKANGAVEVRLYRPTVGGYVDVLAGPVNANDWGAFEILGLADADYVVVTQSSGAAAPAVARVHASDPPTVFEVRSPAGVNVSVTLTSPPRPAPPPTMFRFVDADGIPVVNMFGAFRTSYATATAGAVLVPGHYRLFVWSKDCREGSTEFDVPSPTPLELRLDSEE